MIVNSCGWTVRGGGGGGGGGERVYYNTRVQEEGTTRAETGLSSIGGMFCMKCGVNGILVTFFNR